MKNLYIVRHGQTELNKKGILQGRGVDSELNAVGKEQSLKFYQCYKHLHFNGIFTSSLKRSFQTVEPFLKENPRCERMSALDEISWGILEGKRRGEEENDELLMLNQQWEKGDLSAKIPNGESMIDLRQRLDPFIKNLSTINNGSYLICTHGRTMRVLLSLLLNEELKNMARFKHSNTSLYQIENNGVSKLVLENDLSHLAS